MSKRVRAMMPALAAALLRGQGRISSSSSQNVNVDPQGVGKTSLITAAATESFPDLPPPVLPPTRLPAEATPENVPMLIMDTSSRDEEKTSQEVRRLHHHWNCDARSAQLERFTERFKV